jgi:hypothetical protein
LQKVILFYESNHLKTSTEKVNNRLQRMNEKTKWSKNISKLFYILVLLVCQSDGFRSIVDLLNPISQILQQPDSSQSFQQTIPPKFQQPDSSQSFQQAIPPKFQQPDSPIDLLNQQPVYAAGVKWVRKAKTEKITFPSSQRTLPY